MHLVYEVILVLKFTLFYLQLSEPSNRISWDLSLNNNCISLSYGMIALHLIITKNFHSTEVSHNIQRIE